ncbi:MAG: IreB family regulatory phosphoprotein [Paenibacillaceae bacterium]|jgi:uncharacterized protein (UPF0297 family)|nr:IreB family regulatory phosphoprotein [Paenibacillaceae bacterium]
MVHDHTIRYVPPVDDREASVHEVIMTVYDALQQKGYHPINQLVGYLLSGDPAFIPRQNQARALVRKRERDEMIEELVRFYVAHARDK